MIKKNTKRNIYAMFCLLTIYAYYAFFSFFSIIGIKYLPGLLEYYSIAIFGISVILAVFFYIKKRYISKTELLIFIYILFVLLEYLICDSVYGYNNTANDTLEDFCVRVVPALLMGMIAANMGLHDEIKKGSWITMIYFTLCSSKIVIASILNGYVSSVWSNIFFLDYQSASYIGAYIFGVALYHLFIDKEEKSFFKRLLLYYILTMNAVLSIYSGGRGGVVVIVVMVIALFAYFAFIEKRAQKIFVLLIVLLIALLLFGNFLEKYGFIMSGFTRAFEFINKSGINWEGTSGRQSIYANCIELIKERPFFGYGIMGAPRNGIERTHNIVLEWLIDGGVIYFGIWVVVISKSVVFACKKSVYCKSYAFLLIVFIGEFMMLNFSLVYMRASAIWFVLACLLVSRRNDRLIAR